jgi:predicted ATPase/DNA-binding winged helix-turn-helix (wHTH) protein
MLAEDNHELREVISVGSFQLDPTQRLLSKGDETIKLGARAFDLLLALADRPGEVVSNRELIASVWPGVFVEDVSLRVHIAALRKALEEDGVSATYLKNVPGRGYSLVAPVSRAARTDAPVEARPAQAKYALPPPLARMVGRDDEVRAIREQLLATRFVTVTGPGGVGKTTVALSLAHELLKEFDGAVCFVELSPLGAPDLVAATVTAAFRLPVDSQDPLPGLIAHLHGNKALLVLDSCEHVIAGAAAVAERLATEVPGLTILATSRESLRSEGEYIHRLPPLMSPPDDGKLTAAEALAYPAAQLFVNRIASAGVHQSLSNEDARIVGEMCRKLGGIALAIELAAGRVAAYGVRDTAALLDGQFSLLWPGRRTAPPRHQTLNATLDWSYNLLTESERTVLRRLAVFPGAFTLEAARQVAAEGIGEDEVSEAIAGLVAKSLASSDMSGPVTRYRLLDTTRAYAARKLEEAGERVSVRHSHALHFCELLRATAEDEIPPGGPEASAADLDDIRAALRWAFDTGGAPLLGADIAAYSAPLWLGMALFAEASDWMAKASATIIDTGGAPTPQELRLHIALATTELFRTGYSESSVAAWNRTLERANALNALPAQLLAYIALWGGEIRAARYVDALNTAEKCAALKDGTPDPRALIVGEWLLGHSKHHVGRFAEARVHLERYLAIETPATRLEMIKQTGYDRCVDGLSLLSNTLWMLGFPDQAKATAQRAVAEARALGLALPFGIGMTWALLHDWLTEQDRHVIEHDAVELLEQSRAHAIDSDAGFALCIMGLCEARHVRLGEGARLVTEGLRLLGRAQLEAFTALILTHKSEGALLAHRLKDAASWMAKLESTDKNRDHWCSAEIFRVRGLLAQAQGDEMEAEAQMRNAIALARRQGALSWELRATMSLSKLREAQNRTREALNMLAPVYARFSEGYGSADLVAAKSMIDELRARL